MATSLKRRGRGGDGLYKKRGIWYFRIIDWNGRRRALSARTTVYDEARKRRAAYLADLEKGVDVTASPKLTFAAAAERWIDRCALDLASGTIRCYRQRLKNINAAIGGMLISKITADTVRRYQMLRAHILEASTVNAETKVIAAVLKQGGFWLRVKPEFRFLREPKTRARAVRSDELEKLLQVGAERASDSIMYHVLRLFRETGLRHKELRMLRRRDVDLQNRCIYISRTATKTDAGERIFPLLDDGLDAMRTLMNIASAQGSVDPNHYVFPAIDLAAVHGSKHKKRIANPTKPRSGFEDAWHTLRRLADVDQTLRLHDFRHTVATDMGEAGVPSGIAMELMGWKTPAMRARYEHFQTSALRREIDRVGAFRAGSKAPKPDLSKSNVVPFRRPAAQ
jgi:integrase